MYSVVLYVIVLRALIDNRQLFASEEATLSGTDKSIKVILLLFNCWYFGETYSRKIFMVTPYEPWYRGILKKPMMRYLPYPLNSAK